VTGRGNYWGLIGLLWTESDPFRMTRREDGCKLAVFQHHQSDFSLRSKGQGGGIVGGEADYERVLIGEGLVAANKQTPL
jgi:hypothetical protein